MKYLDVLIVLHNMPLTLRYNNEDGRLEGSAFAAPNQVYYDLSNIWDLKYLRNNWGGQGVADQEFVGGRSPYFDRLLTNLRVWVRKALNNLTTRRLRIAQVLGKRKR